MKKIARRTFLKSATAATVPWQIVPRHVLGGGQTPPSEKLNIASIGVGGQGRGDFARVAQAANDNMLAICDVDPAQSSMLQRDRAVGAIAQKCKVFTDYRKMLDEIKEIDAVVIATHDNMHAMVSMEAIRRGKHVYCEKPLTHDVWEARQVAEAARKAKLATQMGNTGQASAEPRRMCELVWSGVIGPVREAHIWTDRPSNGLFNEYWPQGVARPTDTPPVPTGMDWDLWIGGAPMRPYHPAYHTFKWRGWWDFGTGALGDMGCHRFDPVFRALKLGAPTSVQASSTRVNDETYPVGSMVTYYFPPRDEQVQAINTHVRGLNGRAAGGQPMPPVKLTWYDGGLRPPRPQGMPEGDTMGDNGILLVGDKGYILDNRVYPESLRKDMDATERLPASPGGHFLEWINACKGKLPAAGSNFDWAGPLTEAVLLGDVALRSTIRKLLPQHKLDWDAAALKFTNLDAANQYLRREYRKGWEL
ncbi:MAG TPA: Gfo/Idh/MocA family oxidoreductase [Humisphaera sp.]|jgi:predicted dehydrogenase|nr:Gfo/Idh/MocA family oxidoreductase [Humisphaera sp.]